MAEITLKGEVGVQITLYKTVAAVKQLGNIESLKVNITSIGGSSLEGRQIYEYLKSLPFAVQTNAVGYCYSAAFTIFLAGTQRTASPETKIMMHSPLYIGKLALNAEKAEHLSEAIQKEKSNMAKIYSEILGLNTETTISLMDKNKFIDTETAKSLGIITDINPNADETVEYEIAAMGYLDENHKQLLIKNQNKMDTKELNEKLEKQEGLIGKILGFVEKAFAPAIKALRLATEEGVEIEFQGEELVEGVAVTSDTPDGTYTLMYADKKWTVVIENKIVTTITEIAMDEPTDDVEAIKAENEALKQKIAELEGITAKAEKLEAEVKAIRAITSKFEKPDGTYEFKAEGQENLTAEQEVKAKAKEAVQRYKEKNNL
jgi:ATP-dependent protease ClpP protease subunit